MLPQARTAHVLSDLGFLGGVVEQTIRIPGGRTFKRDYLGCIDQIYIRDGLTLAVQSTTAANGSARVQKSIEVPALLAWLSSDSRAFEVWAWRKVTRGLPRPKWFPRVTRVLRIGDKFDILVDVDSVAFTATLST